MSIGARGRSWIAPGLFWAFLAGVGFGWWLRGGAPVPSLSMMRTGPDAAARAANASQADPAASRAIHDIDGPEVSLPAVASSPPDTSSDDPTIPTIGLDPIAELRHRRLRLPIAGIPVEALRGSFEQGRDRGARAHEAVDIMAPRNTPIQAVEDGVVAKLFLSKAGGRTVYQFDSSGDFCYYYAHLEKYADGLEEGTKLHAGDIIGYVGSSGNASPQAPHLHFAIIRLTDAHHWWEGTPIDPYRVFTGRDHR